MRWSITSNGWHYDHAAAARLAAAIRLTGGLTLRPDQVDTNIVIFRVDPRLGTAGEFCARLKERGLLMLPIDATGVRAVTHLDLDQADVDRACEILADVSHSAATNSATAVESY